MKRFLLLLHTGVWFVIGAVLAWLSGIMPLLNRIEFLKNPVDLGSFLAIIVGFVGGVLWLVRHEKV